MTKTELTSKPVETDRQKKEEKEKYRPLGDRWWENSKRRAESQIMASAFLFFIFVVHRVHALFFHRGCAHAGWFRQSAEQ